MATRTQEIDTIGDLLATVGVSRFYKQNFPTQYVANTIGIRWQIDGSNGLTGAHYTITNTYQIVYFGSSNVDCLNKSELISGIIDDKIDMKTKIRGLDEYITLRSFAFSPPFKTDTDGVYAVIGMLTVSSTRNRTRPTYEKVAEINTDINGGGN